MQPFRTKWMEKNPQMQSQDHPPCPTCGTVLRYWPSLEGDQDRWLCPRCDLATGSLATKLPGNGKEVQETAPFDPCKRFRWLLKAADNFPPGTPLPEWLIEDLPEDIQILLRADLIQPQAKLGPKLSDALTSALRDQGYVIEEDARGFRLSGDLNRRSSSTGGISPYDVIRMASDLDGGLPSPHELKRCPKCEAVLPHRELVCSWCGNELEEETPAPDES